jgi:hypothetical protein
VEDFNKENVYDSFYLLEKVADENNTHEFQIVTFDKSGFSAVRNQEGKVLGNKWKPQISALSQGETINTTLCYAGLIAPVPKQKITNPSLSSWCTTWKSK